MIDCEYLMVRIKLFLLREHPFFGHVLQQLNMKVVDDQGGSIPTMGVGKNKSDEFTVKLYVNSNWVETICKNCGNDEEKIKRHFVEVLKHEVYHLIFNHLSLEFSDKYRGEIACELSVNSYVNRNCLVCTADEKKPGVFPSDFGFESRLGVWDYYRLLEDNKKFKEMVNFCKACQDVAEELLATGMLDSHEKWEAVSKDALGSSTIKEIVRQAREICRQTNNWGNLPAEILEAIKDCCTTKPSVVAWEVILRDFIASSSESVLDYTMKRRSKRYGTRPGTKKDNLLSVAIGIDTSGSISNELLEVFFNELRGIERSGSKMTVFEWDVKVQREYDFSEFDGTVKGRGGTDPTDFLERITSETGRYDCAIVFTDFGFSEIKEDYNLPIMWVVDNWERGDYCPIEDGLVLAFNSSRDGFDVVDL